MDDPPDSRLFVVCGKAAEVRWRTHLRSLHTGVHAALARLHAWRRAQVELLQEAFARFGNVQNVKVVRDKGGAHSCRAPGVLLCADACTQRRVAPRCAASAHAHAAFMPTASCNPLRGRTCAQLPMSSTTKRRRRRRRLRACTRPCSMTGAGRCSRSFLPRRPTSGAGRAGSAASQAAGPLRKADGSRCPQRRPASDAGRAQLISGRAPRARAPKCAQLTQAGSSPGWIA